MFLVTRAPTYLKFDSFFGFYGRTKRFKIKLVTKFVEIIAIMFAQNVSQGASKDLTT